MKFAKSRFFGSILLILALILILTGAFGKLAATEGTPLYGAYADATAQRTARDALQAAISAAEDALQRSGKRTSDAAQAASDCLAAAEDAAANEKAGAYDPETDVGALGQAILDAQAKGADVGDMLDSLAPVLYADLAVQLDDVKTEVKRAENAVEEAAQALQTLANAALALDETAVFGELPAVQALTVPKLGDLAGVQRMLTRAQNYVNRCAVASENARTVAEAGQSAVETAQAVLDASALSIGAKLAFLAHDRAADAIAFGCIVLLAGLALAAFPAWTHKRWQSKLFRQGFLFVAVVALLAAALHYAGGETWALMRQGVRDTLYMTIPSTLLAYALGLPLGVILVITAPGHIRPNATLNNAVGTLTNFLRSIPFIILLVMLFDVTRIVMGTAIGTRAIIFPLFVAAFPYVARVVEGSLTEVDRGVIEAAEAMGSTTWQIILKVLIPEALPSLINGAAICMTTILSYTAMAGSAGGDGLGKIAITYGLNYREYDVMYISSLLLVALVQIIQIAGALLMRAADHRKK